MHVDAQGHWEKFWGIHRHSWTPKSQEHTQKLPMILVDPQNGFDKPLADGDDPAVMGVQRKFSKLEYNPKSLQSFHGLSFSPVRVVFNY